MTRIVYHISPFRLWLPTGFFIALGVGLLASAGFSADEPNTQSAFFLTAIFLLACACVLYIVLRFSRVELSDQGVKLYQIGYTLETTWDNVAALDETGGAQGLVLHRPMDCRGASRLGRFRHTGAGAGLRLYNEQQVRLLSERRLIPIDAFAYWLEHGGLKNELARRAPIIGS